VTEYLHLLRKTASKGKQRRSIMLKVAIRVRKTNSKATTLHPFHPKLSTLISTLHFLSENLSLNQEPNRKFPNEELPKSQGKNISIIVTPELRSY
jgi:hypothetical protein